MSYLISKTSVSWAKTKTAWPQWVNLAAGYLLLVILSFATCLALAAASGNTVVDKTFGEAHLHFEADRSFVMWPDNCVRVRWHVDHIKFLLVNEQGRGGDGEEVQCLDYSPHFRVAFPDGSRFALVIPLIVVNRLHIFGSLVVPAILILFLNFTRHKSWALIALVLAGLGLAYTLCYLFPIYFSPDGRMQYPLPLPQFDRPGPDLSWYLQFSLEVVRQPTGDFLIQNYTPMQNLLFVPLALMPKPTAYAILTGLTLAGYVILAGILPVAMSQPRKPTPLIMLVFVTGLVSYALQFEIQQGQFDVIAMTLCWLALYLFHFHPRLRILAYGLFTVAVQLKLIPILLLPLFVRDWRKWKENIIRFAGIGLANVLSLFVLGPAAFVRFASVLTNLPSDRIGRIENPSLSAFILRLGSYGIRLADKGALLSVVLLGTALLCGAVCLWNVYRRNNESPSTVLLLVCTLFAMILPSLGSDYKLILLAPAMALVLQLAEQGLSAHPLGWLWHRIVLLVLVFAYGTTFFPYTIKTGMFTMNFPALMVMLIAATVLSFFAIPAAQPADSAVSTAS